MSLGQINDIWLGAAAGESPYVDCHVQDHTLGWYLDGYQQLSSILSGKLLSITGQPQFKPILTTLKICTGICTSTSGSIL